MGEVHIDKMVFIKETLKELQQQILLGKVVCKDGKRVGRVIKSELKDNSLFVTLRLGKEGQKILQLEAKEFLGDWKYES